MKKIKYKVETIVESRKELEEDKFADEIAKTSIEAQLAREEYLLDQVKSEEIFEYILDVEPRLDINLKSLNETSGSINLKRITFQEISDTSDTVKISPKSLNEHVIVQVIAMIEEMFPDNNYKLILMNSKINDIDYTISITKVLTSFIYNIEFKEFEFTYTDSCSNIHEESGINHFFELIDNIHKGKFSIHINYKKIEEWILEQQ